jgi:uncharacterized Zn finger protein
MSAPFGQYGPTIRVEGGIKAQSTRGAIGESWWSKRFLTVLESFALGSRLTRGRNYARKGQVLTLSIAPAAVTATVQGSRPKPYNVTVKLAALSDTTWQIVESVLAEQAIYGARLLAGEMPNQIEEVFAAAGAPLFPTDVDQLLMSCSCPDWQVPCKHLAATFYLLAEAFDADPFQILHWRGRDKETLLTHLRALRTGDEAAPPKKRRATKATKASKMAVPPAAIGAAVALADLTSPPLADVLDRFWVAPVPLPTRPPTLDTEVDLILRQLPAPPASLGGAEFLAALRPLYTDLARDVPELEVRDTKSRRS